jgi:hypothetical protein
MNLIKRLIKGSRLSAEDHDFNLNTIEAEFTTVLKKAGYSGTAKDLDNRIQQFKAILDTDDADFDTLQKIVDKVKFIVDDLQNIEVNDVVGLAASLAMKVDQELGKGLSTNDLTDSRLQVLEKAIQKNTSGLETRFFNEKGEAAFIALENIVGLVTALALKVDQETGKGLSTNDLTNDRLQVLENSVQKDVNGSQLRFFNERGNAVAVPTSSYATTIFIDSSINDSTNSVLNERSQPFKTMLDGKNALTGIESAIRFHFISDGVHEGCELQQIDTEFNADSTATIDFTNVNVGTSVIAKDYNWYFTPTYHFVAGRVSLTSNADGAIIDHTLSFTPQFASHPRETWKYKVVISGHIDKIDWRSKPEPHSGINYSGNALFATDSTNLIINEFVSSDPQINLRIFMISNHSKITIRKVSHISGSRRIFDNYYNSTGVGVEVVIDSIQITTGNLSMYSTHNRLSKVFLGDIIGSGAINCPSAIFNNSNIDSGIDLNFSNLNYLSGRILSNVGVRSSYAANIITVENFEGVIQNLTLVSINSNCGIRFKGNNKIYLNGNNNMASVNNVLDGHLLNVVQVLDGITVVEQQDPTGTIFTGNSGSKILEVRSIFKTNSLNIGLAKNQLNNN